MLPHVACMPPSVRVTCAPRQVSMPVRAAGCRAATDVWLLSIVWLLSVVVAAALQPNIIGKTPYMPEGTAIVLRYARALVLCRASLCPSTAVTLGGLRRSGSHVIPSGRLRARQVAALPAWRVSDVTTISEIAIHQLMYCAHVHAKPTVQELAEAAGQQAPLQRACGVCICGSCD
jgi:hypothetical protein